jgi:hypothetical protein
MVQFSLDWTISLGVHIDPIRRWAFEGSYGPYVDLHLLFFVVSLGNHPARAGDLERLRPQAIMRPDH